MEGINLNGLYWDRVRGFISENRIDARWVLREENTDKPYGSLRIVSHPDLPPGHLRSIFRFVVNRHTRDDFEMIKATEDYQMSLTDLEVYSVDEETQTEEDSLVDIPKRLEEIFDVKIFE
jgi:hypothetical protein